MSERGKPKTKAGMGAGAGAGAGSAQLAKLALIEVYCVLRDKVGSRRLLAQLLRLPCDQRGAKGGAPVNACGRARVRGVSAP